jgi:GTP diphosphokinase / guanosine-3',5'-bis(diphosphate) 3'-diphosphatase
MEQISKSSYNPIIIDKYRELLTACHPFLNQDESKQLRKAFDFLLDTHKDLRRETGEPYFIHSVEVAKIVAAEMGLGIQSIISALLQDVLRDTEVKPFSIEKLFSGGVRQLLESLTKISRLRTDRISLHAENFIALLLTITDDVRVILIRLADRLHYMRRLNVLHADDKALLSSETSNLYAPLAHRLGLYNIKTELEDLSMRYAEPAIYQSLAAKLKETEKEHREYLNGFMLPVKRLLHEGGFKFTIKGRTKSIHSIWTKMKKQGVEFEEVYDLFAVRIILNNTIDNEKADCWKVYSLVSNLYPPNPKRLRDWVTVPKENGYESLHTTVSGPLKRFVEVQVRTRRMDENAEKGHASHWLYKGSKKQAKDDEWISHLRTMLERPDGERAGEPDRKTEKEAGDHIFVFTPQGDLKKLRRNATVLDFAYEVHTGIGEKCSGGRVNGQQVPIKHVLKNGDQVEIHTSRNQKPNLDWLGWVVTSRAKNKIRRYLREARFNRSEEGKDILRRKLSQLDLPFNDEVLNKLMAHFTTNEPLEFYQWLAEDKIEIADLKEVLLGSQPKPEPELEDKIREKITNKIKPGEGQSYALMIEGNPGIADYKLAKCCLPVAGEKIFGFVTVSDGIKIHSTNCPNATQMRKYYSYRIVKTEWVKHTDSTGKVSVIKVTGTDRLGILNDITRVISEDLKVNMRSVSLNSKGGNFEGTLKVYVSDKKHLESLLHRIGKVKGVIKATAF